MPADHLMSFADAKWPERHFQGKITPATGKSTRGPREIWDCQVLPLWLYSPVG